MTNRLFYAKRTLGAVLCSLIFCAVAGAAPERKPVKVGYIDYAGFIEPRSDGTFAGYGAEYLRKIADYTGYTYEYVSGEWTELLEKLRNKEIDLICNAQYSKERARQFDFSAYPIGYTQGLLYTDRSSVLCYEDFQMFDGLTVGIIKGSAMIPLFLRYAERHDFACQLVEFGSETEMTAALHDRKIEAMCSEHIANHTGMSLLAEFGADAYYLISYKNSPYIEEVNYALQAIKTDVDFEAQLFHKYYDSSTAKTTLKFTSAERAYIAQCGPLTVGLNASRAPFSEYDEKTGTFHGICADILALVSEKSGLEFICVPQEQTKKVPELLADDKYDIICGIERDNFATNERISATESFLESSIVPVGKAGRNLSLTSALYAAIPASFQALQKTLESYYPNLHMVYYDTNRDCMNAVVSGEADIFIQNTHILSLLLQEPRYEGIDVLPLSIMKEHTAMALLRSADQVLLSILNKSIRNIDPAMISTSLIEHTFAKPYRYTAADFIYKFRVQIAIVSILTTICFVLLISIIVVRRRNERKLEKKNTLLAEAVSQADRASVAKSAFLSRMSHEIRTPMNAIVGITTIAKQYEHDPEKIDDYLNKIEVSSKVLLNIINDVLDMSAIESNKLKIAKSEFDLKQILTGISTIYYPQCQSKGIQFEMATDCEHEILVGDSLRVNQILMNFVSNAYKFTAPGGRISIFVKEEAARKDKTAFFKFSVADTGSGIAEEMKQRLFKPFEQETAETAKKHGGSGLGLSIAKNLIDMMHGAVSVESEKGRGTVFTVDLPLEIVEHRDAADTKIFESIRVLTADDDTSVREYTSVVLKRIGVNFDMASSGSQVLEMIDAANKAGKPYDVCLIDWKMPDMDGIEVTRRIREKEEQKSLIVIISAYDLNEVADRAKEAGADHFVSKPLFQSTVFNVLMMLTKGSLQKKLADPKLYTFDGQRILLAEDNEMNAEIATELLRMVHLQVDRVEDGQKAVDTFVTAEPGTYAVILMDVQMPVLDGYEATRAIRALERPDAKTIPIFAMTANAFTEDVSASLSAGMNGHIAKPIDTGILYETLSKAIYGNRTVFPVETAVPGTDVS